MQFFHRVFVCVALTGLGAGAASAQDLKPWPLSGVNASGYKFYDRTIRASGGGCSGSQSYEKVGDPKDKGVSPYRWTSATQQDGGTLCSGGTWYYGPGDRKGQAGGSMPDILIKGGRYYVR